MKRLAFIWLLLAFVPMTAHGQRPVPSHGEWWRKIDSGLYLAKFEPSKKSPLSTCPVVALRISPEFYDFSLLCASEHEGRLRTARQWCEEFGLAGAINASMYQAQDNLRSTGYMRNFRHVNNPSIHRGFGALMVFNPAENFLPKVQILDLRSGRNWESLARKYHSVVQNYRIISGGKQRGWPDRGQIHSTAAVGVDRDDNVLFILSPSAYSVHDFSHMLLEFPMDLKDTMYVEGGSQAVLCYNLKGTPITVLGTCGANVDQDGRDSGPELPNIIGISRRRP